VTVNVYYPENPSGFASCCINFRKRKLPVKVHSSIKLVAKTFAKLHYATESHSVHRMKAVKPSLSKTPAAGTELAGASSAVNVNEQRY